MSSDIRQQAEASSAYRTTSPREEATSTRGTGGDGAERGRCPDCGTRVPATDATEFVCPDCDVVVDDGPLSRRPARVFDERDRRRKKRTGGRVTLLYADRGIGAGAPASRRRGSGGWTNERTDAEARLAYALGEIRRIGAALSVPRAEREAAARLYRRAAALKCVAGRDIDAFAAASLLVAVRRSRVPLPVSLSELEPVSRTSRRKLRLARSVMERELDLAVPPMDPRHFLPAVVDAFELPTAVERTARDLLDALLADDDARCRGFSPRTLAGAATHLACDIEGYDGPTLDALGGELDVDGCTISQRKSFVAQFADGA